MNLLRVLRHFVLALFIAYVAVLVSSSVALGQEKSNIAANQAAKDIDAILYSAAARDVILAKLKPYAEPMQSMDDVKRRLNFGICFGSGPGVMECQVANSGLDLIFDPDGKLRLMRRKAMVVHGVSYPEMSITDRGFAWHGYQRWYEN